MLSAVDARLDGGEPLGEGLVELVGARRIVLRPSTWDPRGWLLWDVESTGWINVTFQLELHGAATGAVASRGTTWVGVVAGRRLTAAMPLSALDGQRLFLPRYPGGLKTTCLFQPTFPEEADRLELTLHYGGEDGPVRVGGFRLADGPPSASLGGSPWCDALGQDVRRPWEGRAGDPATVFAVLRREAEAHDPVPALPDRSRWGGWIDPKLPAVEANGGFRTAFLEGRWWLVDPDGHRFWSSGPDCVRPGSPTSVVPGTEALFTEPCSMVQGVRGRVTANGFDHPSIDYNLAVLGAALGESWRDPWERLTERRLRSWGCNTIACWSDEGFVRRASLPATVFLRDYPRTERRLFRDLPDVFDPAFAVDAERYARQLEAWRDRPGLLGYFMGNEPAWGFGSFNLAGEMLSGPEGGHSRQALAAWVASRFGGDGAAWRRAWGLPDEVGFESLVEARWSHARWDNERAKADLWEFSRELVRRFVGIPAEALRRVAPGLPNLGLRFAWIASDLFYEAAPWFDVFSYNQYQMRPGVEVAAEIGRRTGKPSMIGEFHFGSLDAGLPGTGLRGVVSRVDRAAALRNYLEEAAACPWIVGAHWFQYRDNPTGGRFDGENWMVGLVDGLERPYPEMVSAYRASHARLARVASGRESPCSLPVREIPKVAH